MLLDKPVGLSSNRALQTVKRLFRARKAGHTGSLDPLASGLLPICLGQATKLSTWLLDTDKRYRVGARFGARTDTGDADGEIVETAPCDHVDAASIEKALAAFCGPLRQVPPMYSALKVKGRPLYELARAGQVIEREPRPIHIYRLELEQYADGLVTLDVACSKGTYIRTLVEDIAQAMGTVAHVVALRRLEAGPYRAEQMMPLEKLEALAGHGEAALDEVLLRPDSALQDWPAVHVGADGAHRLMQGRALRVDADRAGLVRLYDERRFLGIGELSPGGRLAPRRLFTGAAG